MPSLKVFLHDHEPDMQHIILTKWGREVPAVSTTKELETLCGRALQDGSILEIIQSLPVGARECLFMLINSGGKLPWSQFSRSYGDIRVMGAAKRERIHPEREPINISEVLWYSGLIGRAFFADKPEPREFVFVPDEIQDLFMDYDQGREGMLGKEYSLPKGIEIKKAHDYILDDICTILAGLRMGLNIDQIEPMRSNFNPQVILPLLVSMKLYQTKKGLNLDSVQLHLTKPRPEAYYDTLQAWLKSSSIHEILLMPNLVIEGEVKINSPIIRQRLIEMIDTIPPNSWWDIEVFVRDVKANHPEFLRVAGEMDAWFVKNPLTDTVLNGFEHWENVEGAFIRFFIATILFNLGLCDLAIDRKSREIQGFRWSNAKDFLHKKPQTMDESTSWKFYALPQANLSISASAPRSLRYQIARFCDWKGMSRGEYLYQVSPASLRKAGQQDLQVAQLTALLKKHLPQSTSPGLYTALRHFAEKDEFASIEAHTLLRMDDQKIIATILNSDLQKYVLEQLNPTTLVIDPKGIDHLQAKLTELGYLCQVTREV